MHCLTSMSGEHIWSKVVSNLNDRVAAFVTNVIQVVLPHKVNLMRWNKTDNRESLSVNQTKLFCMFLITVSLL